MAALALEEKYNIQVRIEMIGPREAEAYLAKQKFNRPVRMKWINFLANEMLNGFWVMNGETIIFNKKDELIDGQHRLKAVLIAGGTYPFLVVHGADENAFSTIDTGQKRSPSDALYIAGFPHPGVYASLGLNCLRWDKGIFFGSAQAGMKPSNDELVKYCSAHEAELAESVHAYMDYKKRLHGLLSGRVMLFSYHKFRLIDETDAFVFIEKLLGGIFSEDRQQPIRVLRDRLVKNRRDDANLNTRQLFYITFAAWNAYRKKVKLGDLRIPKNMKERTGNIVLV
jgi:hypothetical protein